jgi:transcriptional regulator with XRE-family HTH domain
MIKSLVIMKPIAQYMEEAGMTADQLIAASGLEPRVVKSIVGGAYTPSPAQRQRLAVALGVSVSDISWDHTVEVQHLRGNGPQAGRST